MVTILGGPVSYHLRPEEVRIENARIVGSITWLCCFYELNQLKQVQCHRI